ncbi:GNAT family N-acetyltransferase [Ferrimicrobium sp.]|uniref:GNAT family N-acetyltransferase n=1 Tax=Ferrimicrobium sp. TaxID=2926050 RepID=UPI00262CC66B|nr:GNAT family N-acetyltransferase [Ferrimicrobium sp.]
MTMRIAAVRTPPEEFLNWIPAALVLEHSEAVVAYWDQIPAGLLLFAVDGAIATIHLHYVEPELRNLGIGEQLLEEALTLAKRAGCVTCYGWVSPGDRIAKLTYEAQGFRSDQIRVTREL